MCVAQRVASFDPPSWRRVSSYLAIRDLQSLSATCSFWQACSEGALSPLLGLKCPPMQMPAQEVEPIRPKTLALPVKMAHPRGKFTQRLMALKTSTSPHTPMQTVPLQNTGDNKVACRPRHIPHTELLLGEDSLSHLVAHVRISMPTGRVVRLWVATGHALSDVLVRAWGSLVEGCAHPASLPTALENLARCARVSVAGVPLECDAVVVPTMLKSPWF